MNPTRSRYQAATRLKTIHAMLETQHGATVYDIERRTGLSRRASLDAVRALQRAGENVVEDRDGKKTVFRIRSNKRRSTLSLSTAQMVALAMARKMFGFLDGTGIKDYLDEVFDQIEAELERRHYGRAKRLERKLFDVNATPPNFVGSADRIDEILSALLNEERLRLAVETPGHAKRDIVFEPYTLFLHEKMLYLHGKSHARGDERMYALDAILDADWLRGERFEYPEAYRPESVFEGAFGIIRGNAERVLVRFAASAVRFVLRRRWHPSQKLHRRRDGGLDVSMTVPVTIELQNWILSYGADAEVLEPAVLRDRVRHIAESMAAQYRRPFVSEPS